MIVPSAWPACCGAVLAGAIDARTGLLPDRITRSAGVLAAATALLHGTAVASFLGACAAGGALALLYVLTRGRGLGLGDVKLAIAVGAGLGPLGGISALAAAFVLGGAYAAWLLATGRARRGDALRFGPFIAAGTIASAAGAIGIA